MKKMSLLLDFIPSIVIHQFTISGAIELTVVIVVEFRCRHVHSFPSRQCIWLRKVSSQIIPLHGAVLDGGQHGNDNT